MDQLKNYEIYEKPLKGVWGKFFIYFIIYINSMWLINSHYKIY